MLDLYEELTALIDALEASQIEYAICGGIAMAVHGFTRATEDIDLFVRSSDLDRIEALLADRGYKIKARPMSFASGAMEIRRLSKIDPTDGDLLMIDLLLVTPATEHVWETRERRDWRDSGVSVVSREGLVALKRFRSSDQDLVDIKRLETEE